MNDNSRTYDYCCDLGSHFGHFAVRPKSDTTVGYYSTTVAV